MKKRKRPLAYVWAGCLGVLLWVLTDCGTPPPSLPPTPTPDARARMQTALAQTTADVILNLVGTYVGTYHWHGSTSSSLMRLEITREEGGSLSGLCILGDRSFPLLEGMTGFVEGSQGEDGWIEFMVDVPSGQQILALNFRGDATNEGSMTGDVSASDGRTGTWSVKKR